MFHERNIEDCTPTLNETCRDYFNGVVSASRRMSQLIDALLKWLVDKSQTQGRKRGLSVLAEMIIHDHGKKQPERQVEAVITLEFKVRGDSGMLLTVLNNLLDNVWKFTSKHPTAKIEFGSTDMDGKRVYCARAAKRIDLFINHDRAPRSRHEQLLIPAIKLPASAADERVRQSWMSPAEASLSILSQLS